MGRTICAACDSLVVNGRCECVGTIWAKYETPEEAAIRDDERRKVLDLDSGLLDKWIQKQRNDDA